MKSNYFILSLFFLTACYKEAKEIPFDTFVYSFSAYPVDFSIKITDSDTVYMQKRDNFKSQNFYALLKNNERDSIVKIVERLDFSKYDSIYEDKNLRDGTGIKFYKVSGKISDYIYLYGDRGPKELYGLALQLNEFAKRLQFAPTNKKVDFGDLEYIELPIPPKPNKQAIQ